MSNRAIAQTYVGTIQTYMGNRSFASVFLREAMIRIFQKLVHVSLAHFKDPDHLNESGADLASLQ